MELPIISEKELEFDKVIVFNTSHITEVDDKLLTDIADGLYDEAELMVDSHEYGFRVYVPVDYTDEDFQIIIDKVRKEGLSDSFRTIFQLARATKSNWMKLDCDGSTYKQLPIFDW